VTAFEDGEVSSLTPELGVLTPDLRSLTPELGGGGQVAEPQVISELAQLTEAELAHLQQLANPVNDAKRSAPESIKITQPVGDWAPPPLHHTKWQIKANSWHSHGKPMENSWHFSHKTTIFYPARDPQQQLL